MRAERPDLSELVGRQALFVVNLPPRRMAGEVSEGMLFDIGFADGILPALAMPERPVPNGARAARAAPRSDRATARTVMRPPCFTWGQLRAIATASSRLFAPKTK